MWDGVEVVCPYCGERVELVVDPLGGDEQRYVEDCEICCRPWLVEVRFAPPGQPEVRIDRAD